MACRGPQASRQSGTASSTFIGRAAFTEMLHQHPELYIVIVTTLVARQRQSDEDMATSSFLTVRARGPRPAQGHP